MTRGASALFLLFLVSAPSAMAAGVMAKVLATVNGSTISVDLRGKTTSIRLHGIATPDPNDKEHPILQKLGSEATEFLREYLKNGWVYLEFPTGEPQADADGVVNAFVYRGTDAIFVNEKIVGEGFGVVNRKVASAFRDKLIVAENRAQASQNGIWGSFENGSGRKVASGEAHQGEFIGQLVPEGRQRTTGYVTYWIFLFR